jgi:cell wall-associated NlpC family hydrolase
MTVSPDGNGYTLAGADGGIYPFGNAVSYGSNDAVVPTPPVTHIVSTPDGQGYWLLDPDAFSTSFAHPAPNSALGATVVAIASGEIGADPLAGVYCNPYGPCEQWCALFATWVWEHAGIAIPHYAFTGDIYQWVAQRQLARSPAAPPNPGDLVLFGTGPATTSTSAHVGVVAQVWPDGAIVTVEGDAGPGPLGRENVIVNGPFLPSQSKQYNGFPIYAYAALG